MDNNRPVKFGTPLHNQPSLCRSCRNATHLRGLAESQDYIVCKELPYGRDLIRMTVIECSMYDDRGKPTLRHMEQIAWELATDKSGQKIGFLSPQDFKRRREAKEIGDPGYLHDPVTGETIC